MKQLISIILLFICFANSSWQQEFYGVPLDFNKGLLSRECYDIQYDNNGYLIVGTQYGIMRYNGELFEPICLNLPLEHRFFYDLEKGSNGVLYGFNSKYDFYTIFNKKAYKIYVRNNPIQQHLDVQILKLKYTTSGLYIYTNNQTYFLNFKANTINVLPYSTMKYDITEIKFVDKKPVVLFYPQPSLTSKKNRNLVQKDITNTIKIQFEKGKETFFNLNQRTRVSRQDIIPVGNNYYVLTSANLFLYRKGVFKRLDIPNVLFIEHFYHRVWVLTRTGLFELDENGNILSHHFKGQQVGAILPTGKKGLIISFSNNSLLYVRNIDERKYTLPGVYSVKSNGQSVIMSDTKGNIFTLKNDALIPVLNIWDEENLPFNPIRNPPTIKYHSGLKEWIISGEQSFFKFPDSIVGKAFTRTPYHKGNRNNPPKEFYYDGQRFIALCFSSIEQYFPNHQFIDVNSRPRCALNINDTLLLYGTNNFLHFIQTKTNKKGRFNEKIQGKIINDIYYTGGKIYVVTRYYGIYVFKGQQLLQIIQPPCLSLNKINVYNGKIYTCGNMGVFELIDAKKGKWEKLFDDEIIDFAILKNKLYILQNDGLITKKINADFSNEDYLFRLNQVKINNHKSAASKLSAQYNSSIQFKIDIVKFDAKRTGLYYKLQGRDVFRKKTEGTVLNFDAMEAGNYTLTVFPVINDKIDLSKKLIFSFSIEYPYWQTNAFYVLVILFLIVSIYALKLLSTLRKKRKIAERRELENKVNEYKLLAVKAQVNPHFISNGFAAIQALILKNDTERAAQYLAKFSLFMRRILNYSENPFITIEDELALMDLYIELEQLRFKDNFSVKREVELSNEELKKWKIPSLMIQPILENAIWHGLRNSSQHPQLGIVFKKVGSKLRIEISDNGPGFQQNEKKVDHLSKGNKLITERIDTLNLQKGKTVATFTIMSNSLGSIAIFEYEQELTNPN